MRHSLLSSYGRMCPDFSHPVLARAASDTASSAEPSPEPTTRPAKFADVMTFVGEFYQTIADQTSLRSFPRLGSSGMMERGQFLTLSSLALHSADAAYSVCSLARTLETEEEWLARGKTASEWQAYITKYYLSPTACAGILRRAEARGRDLPRVLREALESAARMGVVELTDEEMAVAVTQEDRDS